MKSAVQSKQPEKPRVRRSQAERSAQTRRKLIAAATDVLCAKGYANATLLDIAKRAGVSRGAAQHHFGNRYDVFDAVAEKLTEDMLSLTAEIPRPQLTLEERVEWAIQFYWKLYSSKTFHAILHIYLGLNGESHRRPVQRDIANAYIGSDRPWFELFDDTGNSREFLTSLRRVVLASLRGLAVGRFLGIAKAPVQPELEMLSRMTHLMLTDGHKKQRDIRAARPAATG